VKTKSEKSSSGGSSHRSKKSSKGGRYADDVEEEEDAGAALNWVLHEARADASLAAVDGALGNWQGSRDAHAAALAARLRAAGGRHPDVAASLLALAEVQLALGRVDEARQSAARALDVLVEAHEPADAASRRALGAPDAASTRYVGVTHPAVAEALCLLARCHCEQGDYPACQAALGSAMRIVADFVQGQNDAAGLGHLRQHTKYAQMDTHGAAAAVKVGLGELALALSEYDRAHDYLESALSVRSFCLGERHPATAATLRTLCDVLHRRGKVAFAKKALLRCIRLQVRPGSLVLGRFVRLCPGPLRLALAHGSSPVHPLPHSLVP